MTFRLEKKDFDFICEVQRLGERGRSQAEIAEALGIGSDSTLKFRLAKLGFELRPGNAVKTTLTGQWLADLLEEGSLVASDPDPSTESEAAADSALRLPQPEEVTA